MSTQDNKHLDDDVQEDFLEVDRPIPGQSFVCLSFISPEKVIKDKSLYILSKFIESLTTENKLPEGISSDDVKEDLLPKYKNKLEELAQTGYSYSDVENAYKDFLYTNEKKLGDDFDEQNEFRTSVRGLKVRGTYSTRREAEIRAKVLQKRDPKFHVYVGSVGYWLPWDPNPDEIEDQEYNDAGPEANLNRLAKQYKQNLEDVDVLYEEERENKRKQAIEENKRRRAEIKKLEEEKAKESAESKSELGGGLESKVDNSGEGDDTTEVSNIGVEPSAEDIQNIEKLRNIVNEKELKYSGQAGLSSTHVDGEDVIKASPLDDSKQEVVSEGDLAQSIMTSDDPWMKRKLEQEAQKAEAEAEAEAEASEAGETGEASEAKSAE
jgi:hypothetical protein